MPFLGSTVALGAFTFAQVTSALAVSHRVDESRFSAFQSRIKHYQKQGFPNGTNTGRGKAAGYSIGHAIELAFALEMNEIGLTPDRARLIISQRQYEVRTAAATALDAMSGRVFLPIFLMFDPSGLKELRDPDDDDMASLTFKAVEVGDLPETIERWSYLPFRRLGIINLTAMLIVVINELGVISGCPRESILEAGLKWANGSGEGPDSNADNPQA